MINFSGLVTGKTVIVMSGVEREKELRELRGLRELIWLVYIQQTLMYFAIIVAIFMWFFMWYRMKIVAILSCFYFGGGWRLCMLL